MLKTRDLTTALLAGVLAAGIAYAADDTYGGSKVPPNDPSPTSTDMQSTGPQSAGPTAPDTSAAATPGSDETKSPSSTSGKHATKHAKAKKHSTMGKSDSGTSTGAAPAMGSDSKY